MIKEGTNCSHCHETCHADCPYADDKDKYRCIAMTDGKCRICTHKCDWYVHYNQGYVFELVRKKVKRYHAAEKGRNACQYLISTLQQKKEMARKQAEEGIKRARECLLKLDEIALKPDPLSETDYIDLLIQEEKRNAKAGFLNRVEQLELLKNSALILQSIKQNTLKPVK